MSSDAVWIFGYGSITWRPAFRFGERRPGFVRGWARRFWQGSTDHRGVPGAPGRVVTLVRETGAVCWGAAYRIEEDEAPEVLARLDEREKGGFDRCPVTVEFGAGDPVGAVLYVAGPANLNYLGPAPLDEIARQVSSSAGPSGSNREYVLRLAEALRGLGAHDDHVYELERRLRSETACGEGA